MPRGVYERPNAALDRKILEELRDKTQTLAGIALGIKENAAKILPRLQSMAEQKLVRCEKVGCHMMWELDDAGIARLQQPTPELPASPKPRMPAASAAQPSPAHAFSVVRPYVPAQPEIRVSEPIDGRVLIETTTPRGSRTDAYAAVAMPVGDIPALIAALQERAST